MTVDTLVPLPGGHTVRLGACILLTGLQARGCYVNFDRVGLLVVEPCGQLTPSERDALTRYAVDLALLVRHTMSDTALFSGDRPSDARARAYE